MTDIAMCEQFCPPNTTPIGPGGSLPTEETKGECARCAVIMTWLCHDVLPAIRRNGYYVPTGTPVEAELQAMIDQQGWSDQLAELLGDAAGLFRGDQ